MSQQPKSGLVYALLAFLSWGILPLYWKPFEESPALEVVCHRVLWSFVLLFLWMLKTGEWREVLAIFRRRRETLTLLVSALLLFGNWGLFIHAVATEQVVQSGLGYFLCPLVSIFFARVILKEELSLGQGAAVALAAGGVALYGWHLGTIPWIALGLALSFGLYGLLRKQVAVPSLIGLMVENTLLAPLALLLAALLHSQGKADFGTSWGSTLLFISTGVITTVPLYWFNQAAKLLRLSTLGFLQYLTPTMHLLVGIVIFGEAFDLRHSAAFILIWAAIGLYLWSGKVTAPAKRSTPAPEEQLPPTA